MLVFVAINPAEIASGNTVQLTQPAVIGILDDSVCIEKASIASGYQVKVTQLAMIGLLVGYCRNKTSGVSLREHSSAHTTRGDNLFGGFLSP
jgi:hypothetical protein